MSDRSIVALLEQIIKLAALQKTEKGEISQRCVNILGKATKNARGLKDVTSSKFLLITLLTGFCSPIDEMNKSALIAFHQCCKYPGFRELCLTTHAFKLETFDAYCKTS
jgi:hypothetical protein